MQWIQDQQEILHNAQCIVIKVGSAVLTNEHGLDAKILQSIADQIAFLHTLPTSKTQKRRIVLVSSGAVAAGRAVMRTLCPTKREQDTCSLADKQAAAAIGQGHLMQHYTTAFAQHGLGTAQILLTRDDVRSRQRFLNARNTFATLLSWDIVPIVNENDTVSVHELKFGDNDCLASLLVNLVEAQVIINLTSAPGVLDKNPLEHHDGTILPCIPYIHDVNLDQLCGGKTSVGTGGMYSKLLAARRVAHLGVPTLILPGREDNILRKIFKIKSTHNDTAITHETYGTWIPAKAHSISRRKFWLAYQSTPAGSIFVDAGAATALEKNGSSLLPVGIRAVEGTFSRGALVRIVTHDDKRNIGVGLSNYSSAEVQRVMGLSWELNHHEMIEKLGSTSHNEAIHRDNLLLDAAL